jgi:hypothetical protein
VWSLQELAQTTVLAMVIVSIQHACAELASVAQTVQLAPVQINAPRIWATDSAVRSPAAVGLVGAMWTAHLPCAQTTVPVVGIVLMGAAIAMLISLGPIVLSSRVLKTALSMESV